MSLNPIFLYGSAEAPAATRRLAAGPLAAQLDEDGALRGIRWRGVEVLRAVTFLVRTAGWGTPAAQISGLAVDDSAPDRFTLAYDARVSDGGARLEYRIEIEAYCGARGGRLEARATIRALDDFSTNRTGFVVLHPLAGVAGQRVEVEHVDGRRETLRLAAQINPAQPLREIRALTTFPLAGVRASARLEGDTFEMEDQRNWSDASFKTYSRPLALPFPYVLTAGSTTTQRVVLDLAEQASEATSTAALATEETLSVRLLRNDQADQAPAGRLPRIGIAVPGELARASLAVAAALRAAAPNFVLAHYDASLGHGADELRAVAELARSIGAPVKLEVVVADDADPDASLAGIAALAARAGLAPAALAVFAKVDETSYQPGQPRPASPQQAALYRAARAHFPGIPLIGGSPALFTELNRRRPPAQLLDALSHASCPIVHDASDEAVMQTLETLPWIAASVRAIAGRAAYHLGPVAIGTRLNPYGEAPAPNPDNRRVGLAKVDPRQRGLFGAAWYLGYAAAAAAEGVAELTLAGSIGAFGLVHTAQDYPQPWFDQLAGQREQPAVFPAWHVVRALSRAAGRPRIDLEISDRSRLAALCWTEDGRARLALANLTADAQQVRVDGGSHGDLRELRGRRLDAASFASAALAPDAWNAATTVLSGQPQDGGRIELPPYALALIGD